MRLPAAQARALRSAGWLSLELISPKVRKGQEDRQQPEHLMRRFPGRFASMQPMTYERSIAIVELGCDPPEEAVRELALGEIIEVRLLWVPPLWTLPLFAFGLPPLLAGIVAVGMRRRVAAGSREILVKHQTEPANAKLAGAGADAAALRSVGAQLGSELRAASLDPSLIATAEWVLDRHGVSGARFLGEGLACDDEVRSGIDRLVGRHRQDAASVRRSARHRNKKGSGPSENGRNGRRPGHSAERGQDLVDRLLRVLDAIDSEWSPGNGASAKGVTRP